MNSIQRWKDCIDSKPIDRTPITFWHHYAGEQAQGRACVEAHLDLYKRTGIDMVKVMSDGYNDLSFGYKVTKPSDWDNIPIPKLGDPFVTQQADRLKGIVEGVRGEAAVYYVIFAAFTLMRMSYGREMCWEHLHDPRAREHLLPAMDRLGDFVAEAAGYYIRECGLTGNLPCFNNNPTEMITEEQYRQWLRPQDEKLIRAIEAESRYNIAHFCGWSGLKNNMDAWNDYPAAAAHWDVHTDRLPLAQGRDYFPNVRAIMGGFDNKEGSVLYTGSKQEVQAAARAMVEEGGRTGFLLSSDCSLLPDVEYERIVWVREALEDMA